MKFDCKLKIIYIFWASVGLVLTSPSQAIENKPDFCSFTFADQVRGTRMYKHTFELEPRIAVEAGSPFFPHRSYERYKVARNADQGPEAQERLASVEVDYIYSDPFGMATMTLGENGGLPKVEIPPNFRGTIIEFAMRAQLEAQIALGFYSKNRENHKDMSSALFDARTNFIYQRICIRETWEYLKSIHASEKKVTLAKLNSYNPTRAQRELAELYLKHSDLDFETFYEELAQWSGFTMNHVLKVEIYRRDLSETRDLSLNRLTALRLRIEKDPLFEPHNREDLFWELQNYLDNPEDDLEESD
jgi:hypothetical protein